jgi:hypothetical protein
MAVPDAQTERLAAHARWAVAQFRWTPAPSSPREAPGAPPIGPYTHRGGATKDDPVTDLASPLDRSNPNDADVVRASDDISAQLIAVGERRLRAEGIARWITALEQGGVFEQLTHDAGASAPDEVIPPAVGARVSDFLHTAKGRRRAAAGIARSIVVWAALETAETMTPAELRAGLSEAEAEQRLNAMLADDRFLSLAMVQALHEEAILLRVVVSHARPWKPGAFDGFGVKEAGREYTPGGPGGDEAGLATAARRAVERLKGVAPWPRRLPRKGERAELPTALPQQTFPEAKAVASAFADGPKFRHWKPGEGEIALYHQAPARNGQPASLRTKLVGNPLLDWLGRPSTVEGLREELRGAGLPAVLLEHVVIAGSLELAEKNKLYVTVAVDDLIAAIGWKPRRREEREGMRRQVWRWLALLDASLVIGRRPGKYRDPDTHQQIDLTSLDALIRITGQRKPAQLAFDDSAPPLEVTYAAGPWIEQWRGKRHILTYFGDVRRLAAIPAGKPSGAWAQAIGLALNQRWRERSSYADIGHVGEDKTLTVRFGMFTRRELLDPFPPDPSADDILEGPNPRYAKAYWRDAIALLKQHGVVGHYREIGVLPDKRQGWQRVWLDQELDIRPAADGKQAAAEIATRARAVRRARATRKTKPGQLVLPTG